MLAANGQSVVLLRAVLPNKALYPLPQILSAAVMAAAALAPKLPFVVVAESLIIFTCVPEKVTVHAAEIAPVVY